jgi:hypothetical protein
VFEGGWEVGPLATFHTPRPRHVSLIQETCCAVVAANALLLDGYCLVDASQRTFDSSHSTLQAHCSKVACSTCPT